jgi:hypothetical protein
VAATPHLLNTLISYWKLDEASGTRSDTVAMVERHEFRNA